MFQTLAMSPRKTLTIEENKPDKVFADFKARDWLSLAEESDALEYGVLGTRQPSDSCLFQVRCPKKKFSRKFSLLQAHHPRRPSVSEKHILLRSSSRKEDFITIPCDLSSVN